MTSEPVNSVPNVDETRRIASLDGVRGIAILMVLAVHLQQLEVLPASYLWLRRLMYVGWSGVDLFFVLSGFLITGILLDTRDRSGRAQVFYARRALRIFPLFYLAVLIGIVLTPFAASATELVRINFPSLREWVLYLCYLQNWAIPITNHNILGQFWSLGVEEQFYLLWPWCVWMVPRKSLHWVCLGGIAAAPCIRLIILHFVPPVSPIVLMNTFCRMDTLLFGSLCAIAVRSDRWSRIARRLILPAVGLALFTMAGIDFLFVHELWSRGFWTQSVGYTALAIGYSAVLLAAYFQSGSRTALDRILKHPFLRFCGKYSYGLYVWHVPVFFLGILWGRHAGWWGQSFISGVAFCIVLTSLSILVAVASYEFYEKWFLLAKPKFHSVQTVETVPGDAIHNRGERACA